MSDPARIEEAANDWRKTWAGSTCSSTTSASTPTSAVAGADPAFEAVQGALHTKIFGAYRLDGPTGGLSRDGWAIAF